MGKYKGNIAEVTRDGSDRDPIIVRIENLDDNVTIEFPIERNYFKKIEDKFEIYTVVEYDGKTKTVRFPDERRLKDYYPGPNPPQIWNEKHPYNMTCDQCKNTFVDRAAFMKHFEKKGSTCIFHS